MVKTPTISIITACYNHGIYLDDAFSSIKLEKYNNLFEYIIVDDGSTDLFTLAKLDELEKKGSIVIHQNNQGLGAARNAGIKISRGKYIIPLDCDNKINPEVIIEASKILEADEKISVVYSDAEYFGDIQGRWIVGPFNHLKLINGNYIDACALFKKSSWDLTNGYDTNMPSMGHEDWDFWLNIYFNNGKFKYLPKIGYYYRKTEESMSFHFAVEKVENIKKYLFGKYYNFIPKSYNELFTLAYPENSSGMKMINTWMHLFLKIIKRSLRYMKKVIKSVFKYY